ncbi:MAG TPA: hypothetical protein VFH64_12240 [Amnibacterium sp.]|nr:hypothetical protein [Amnibacterium sp.]
MILSQPKWWAVGAVWAGTLVAAIVLAAAVQGPFVWVALTLTATVAVVVGIVVQLAVGEQVGFVERLVATACGSFLLVLLVALVRLVAGA